MISLFGLEGCDGCDRRKSSIIAAWDFGEFFWSIIAGLVSAFIVLPLVAMMLRNAGIRHTPLRPAV